MNTLPTDHADYQRMLTLYTNAPTEEPDADGTSVMLLADPAVPCIAPYRQSDSLIAASLQTIHQPWPDILSCTPHNMLHPALTGRRLPAFQFPQPCISPYALSVGCASDSDTSLTASAPTEDDAPEARASSPQADVGSPESAHSQNLRASVSTRAKRARDASPQPANKRGKVLEQHDDSMFEYQGRMGGHEDRSTLATGFIPITAPSSVTPTRAIHTSRQRRTKKSKSRSGKARSPPTGSTLPSGTAGQRSTAAVPLLGRSTPDEVEDWKDEALSPLRASSAEVDQLLLDTIEGPRLGAMPQTSGSRQVPSSPVMEPTATDVAALPPPVPTSDYLPVAAPSAAQPRRSGRFLIPDIHYPDGQLPPAGKAPASAMVPGVDMHAYGLCPRKAALRAKAQIAAQSRALGTVGRSSGKRCRAYTPSKEDSDFIPDEGPSKKKRRPASSHGPPRDCSATPGPMYTKGSRRYRYSRNTDYLRFACSKLHDNVQCAFCDREPTGRGLRISRLPDTAYRHLNVCDAFKCSTYYRLKRAWLMRKMEEEKKKAEQESQAKEGNLASQAKVPIRKRTKQQRAKTTKSAKQKGDTQSDLEANGKKKDNAKEELMLHRRVYKAAVKDHLMVLQVPCLKNDAFQSRAREYNVSPTRVEEHLKRYATLYKIDDSCSCCSYPEYSTYDPAALIESKTWAALAALEGEEGAEEVEDEDGDEDEDI
ncbi:hypothetical protein OH77DRAFT_936865 [Trametes cingulata]|nr:hypothetical protein OH77DRAFT_936865 [Trametes cingulata]